MTLTELLAQLDKVKPQGSRWVSCCPSHDDRSPSLSIREGDRGLLLRCWAGCSVREICDALGIKQQDLFFDALDTDPQARRAAARQRDERRQQQAAEAQRRGRQIDALKAADLYIQSKRGLDISNWTNLKLHLELNRLADSYDLLATEEHDAQSAG